jgi:hypothetical protein
MKGKLVNLIQLKNGKYVVTIELDGNFPEFDELKENDVDITVEKYREKRSKNANGYMWALCEKIARKINATKYDVYKQAVREVGVFQDIAISEKAKSTFKKVWEAYGTGYFIEDFGMYIRAYYGSHNYNTAQMSRVIDYIVSEAKALNIDTLTPNEIINLVNLWESVE